MGEGVRVGVGEKDDNGNLIEHFLCLCFLHLSYTPNEPTFDR